MSSKKPAAPASSTVVKQTLRVVAKPVVKAATTPVLAPAKTVIPAAPVHGLAKKAAAAKK